MRKLPRRESVTPLKAAIEEFLDRYRLRDGLGQTRVVAAWEKVVGKTVARHTGDLQIRHRVLYVKVDSAALRNELVFARTKIMAKLNQAAGLQVIDEIRFL